MKKVLNIALCLSIVISAVVYAATKIDFDLGGLTGQLKTKLAASVTETNGWVVFSDMGEKDLVTVYAVDNVKGIVMDGGKLLKQKGSIVGNIDSIVIAQEAPSIVDPSVIVSTLAGNDKLSIKLKGISVGTIIAKNMKMVIVNDIDGALGGTLASGKGIKVLTTGDIAGDATERMLVGAYDYNVGGEDINIPVATMIKSIKSKKGAIGYVDASNATAAKPTKTKWIAKVPSNGDVLVAAGQFDAVKSLKKNVVLTEPVTQ